ncbi:MAG: wax ester/triacylglycerol synthase family O-acyltransferase [Oscillochloridaceae bacterium umkhey_bin13]
MPQQARARIPLASADAAWLHMDEPTNPMVITVALIMEQPVSMNQLRDLIEQRLLNFARFRQRVDSWRGGSPHWEDDPNFMIEAHLHHVGLPGAGDDAALRELISGMVNMPLDPTRPLWQFYLVDHYGTGCVLVLRVHHCLADGVTLVHVFNALMDQPLAASTEADSPTDPMTATFDAITAAIRSTEQIIRQGWSWASHPERVLGLLGSGAAVLGKLALMGPDAPSIFKGKLGMVKQASWTEPVTLEQIKAIGKVTGGTVNDVILTAVAGALRRYMTERAAPISLRGMRAMVPVNLLPPEAKSDSGNHFGLVYVTLPVGIDDPIERMAQLRREMDAIKASPEAYVAFGVINLLGSVPVDVEHSLRDLLCSMASMIVTNVPGPRTANSLAGVTIKRAMFWVPKSGPIGLGISILSYAGSVQVGILADMSLVPDPERMAEAFDLEFAELVELTSIEA